MFPRLSPRQMRWSGWILLAGSILLIIVNYLVLSTPVSSSGLPSIPLSALEMIGGLLVFIGLPATYLRQRKEVGTLGLIGFILFWVSSLLVTVVLSGYAIFYAATTPPPAHPGVAIQLPAVFQYISSSGLLQLIGTLLYGVPTYRARVFPGAAGILLIAAAVVVFPQFFISGTFIQLFGLLGTFLLLLGLARLGYALARWPEYFEDKLEEEKEVPTLKDFIS
jgi:hypothetical protein